MPRVVIDPNVLISARLSPRGTPARLLAAWTDGRFELVISPALGSQPCRDPRRHPRLRRVDRLRHASDHRRLLAFCLVIAGSALMPAPLQATADAADDAEE